MDAKTRICDRGTRKRHARCHDAVEAALTGPLRSRFETCTTSAQGVGPPGAPKSSSTSGSIEAKAQSMEASEIGPRRWKIHPLPQ